jgi:hypothetical protein
MILFKIWKETVCKNWYCIHKLKSKTFGCVTRSTRNWRRFGNNERRRIMTSLVVLTGSSWYHTNLWLIIVNKPRRPCGNNLTKSRKSEFYSWSNDRSSHLESSSTVCTLYLYGIHVQYVRSHILQVYGLTATYSRPNVGPEKLTSEELSQVLEIVTAHLWNSIKEFWARSWSTADYS